MISCRVVASLLLFLLTYDHSVAVREVDQEQLMANLVKWRNLTQLVDQGLGEKTNPPLNPFNMTGFLSNYGKANMDGSAVLLSAKNVTPDMQLTEEFAPGNANDPCTKYREPKNYKRDAVPLFTIAVFANVTSKSQRTPREKFAPYICALRRHTEMIIFIDISNSLVGPPQGDICNTMILIRQSLHSARFLVTIFSEQVLTWKPTLCRPIVWGNLSPYLQIRRSYPFGDKETLVFLATKGGSINFAVEGNIHTLGNESETERQRKLSHLYVIFDNTAQLAHKSSLGGRENYLTGPRFAIPNVEAMKAKYQHKRRILRDYLVSEGQDFSYISMLLMLPVLLFAGVVTIFIHINPQIIANEYERVVEVVTEEPDSKREKKDGMIEALKRKVAPDNRPSGVSQGERKKKNRKKNSQDKAEVTADGEMTVKTGLAAEPKKADDKTSATKKSKAGFGSFGTKKLRKRKTVEKTSENEVTATVDTVTGTEATAAASLTAPGSN